MLFFLKCVAAICMLLTKQTEFMLLTIITMSH